MFSEHTNFIKAVNKDNAADKRLW